jgi:hypothetical protein
VRDGAPLGLIKLQASVSQRLKVKEWKGLHAGFLREG